MKKILVCPIIAAVTSLGAGCDDIELGHSWTTTSITVTTRERDQSPLDTVGATADAPPVLRFEWDGMIAEEVRVERCEYDCENQPADFCWDKTNEYIEEVILPRTDEDYENGAGCGWAVGACSSFGDCPANVDLSDGVDYSEMIPGGIDYASLPDEWFIEPRGEPVPLEDGAIYAVGVFGFDCSESSEPCEQVFGCRFFRMEGGQPVMMHGTGD